jgi:hypothetical protein
MLGIGQVGLDHTEVPGHAVEKQFGEIGATCGLRKDSRACTSARPLRSPAWGDGRNGSEPT